MKPIEKTIETVFERKKIHEARRKDHRAKITKLVSIVSCACLLLGVFVGVMLIGGAGTEDYRILLDINPSIEISVDGRGNVKDAYGLNEDGGEVLGEMKLSGETSADAIRSIVSELVDRGYINEEANSVLVSIEGANEKKSESIKKEIAGSISEALDERDLEGAIIVQVLHSDSEMPGSQLEEYGVSAGKAQLIYQILEQNKFHTFEELAEMSIHELNLLRVSYYVDMDGSYESGSPVEIAYVGAQSAKDIALTDAQVSADECVAKLECLNSAMVYRVEFETEINKYRYNINAVTGEIISAEKIDFGEDSFFVGDTEAATIGENAALLAASSHAGMEGRTLVTCKYNRDWVNGTVVYNIFFTDGIASGRYVINARTGEILQYSVTQEYHDRSVKADVIGDLEAKRIALAEDGIIDGNVSKYEMRLTADGETYVYELDYICNAARYTVRIDAVTGNVLSFEKEVLKDTGDASVENGNNPSVEGENTPSVEGGNETAPENEGGAPAEDGNKPSVEDGNKPSAEDGNKPSAEDGNKPSAEDGNKPSAEDGNKPSAEDGNKPSAEDGNKPSAEEGNKPSAEDGNKPSAEDGNKPSAEDGNNTAAEG